MLAIGFYEQARGQDFLRRAPRQLFEIEVVFGPKLEVAARLIIAPVPAAVTAERRRRTRLAASKQGRTPTQRTLNRCSWTLLLSNASPEQLPTTTALVVYGVRWQVELTFKLFKSDAKLETSLGSEKHRVECEFYAKLIALLFFNRVSGLVENFAGEKISPPKLWRRMRDEASDLLRVLGQGKAQSLGEMLKFLSRYTKPRAGKKHPSTLQRLEVAAGEARQVIFKDPLGYVRERRKTIAEGRKAFTGSLESYKVKLNSEKLSNQRTVSLPYAYSSTLAAWVERGTLMISDPSSDATFDDEAPEPQGGQQAKSPRPEAIRHWLVSKLADALSLEPQSVDLTEPVASYGLGAIQALTLVAELEDWLGRELPPTLLWDNPTLEEVIKGLSEDSVFEGVF